MVTGNAGSWELHPVMLHRYRLTGPNLSGCVRTPWSRVFGLRQVHAGDLDDGLPRGFLAGVIVEVWVALHLDWA